MRICGLVILVLCVFSLNAAERPPQFVNLAFDGSKSFQMWKETTEFAKREGIKFTYFISGVYFISNKDKQDYDGPGVRPGYSAIGFGGKSSDVKSRNSWLEAAYQNGHEIASHANGHFDGSSWSYNQWNDEIRQFEDSVENSPYIYGGVKNKNNWKRALDDKMIGFRAPLLGNNKSMYKVLRDRGYHYDTSKAQNANYWPKKINGIWNFPLAALRMARSNKRTLSMDYNMYVAQSKGKRGSSANFDRWEDEVYETYLKYFKANYLGNRAPLDIGHHFSLWNGGIYWRAMKRFARTVCSLPEVVCGTYTDLVKFLDSKSSSTIKAYQAGSFKKLRNVKLPASLKRVNYKEESMYFTDKELREMEKHICPAEAHLHEGDETQIISDGFFI